MGSDLLDVSWHQNMIDSVATYPYHSSDRESTPVTAMQRNY